MHSQSECSVFVSIFVLMAWIGALLAADTELKRAKRFWSLVERAFG